MSLVFEHAVDCPWTVIKSGCNCGVAAPRSLLRDTIAAQSAELLALRERVGMLEGALRNLVNEVRPTWEMFEVQTRRDVGNTNYQCVVNRLKEAQDALSSPSPAAKGVWVEKAALDDVFIGGNHLASQLVGEPIPPVEATAEYALRFYGSGPKYDMWVCWRALMRLRAAMGG